MKVGDWLSRLGLAQYKDVFARHGIDEEVLKGPHARRP
jgi:SAM domain (Sterile alpha motif)